MDTPSYNRSPNTDSQRKSPPSGPEQGPISPGPIQRKISEILELADNMAKSLAYLEERIEPIMTASLHDKDSDVGPVTPPQCGLEGVLVNIEVKIRCLIGKVNDMTNRIQL